MSSINFTPGVVIPSTWLNDINTVAYTFFGNGTSLNSPTKISVNILNASGYVTGSNSPQNPGGLGGNRFVIDTQNGQTRFFTYGIDAASNGSFVINSQRSNGTNSIDILTLSGTGVLTIPTSVVTPIVDSGTTSALTLRTNNGAGFTVLLNNAGDLSPGTDNVWGLGTPANRWARLFTPVLDSGTTASLLLRTNNGQVGFQVFNNSGTTANNISTRPEVTGSGPLLQAVGSDTNIQLLLSSAGTGSIRLFTGTSNAGGLAGITEQLAVLHTASATRSVTITGAVSPNQPQISSSSGGGLGIQGTNTNDNTTAGNVGQYVESIVNTGSAITLSTASTANITSISLTAGDWDVSGVVSFIFGATTSYTNLFGGPSNSSAAAQDDQHIFDYETAATVPTAGSNMSWVTPTCRYSLSATTTIFLVVQGTFTVSTLKAYGTIRARRIR